MVGDWIIIGRVMIGDRKDCDMISNDMGVDCLVMVKAMLCPVINYSNQTTKLQLKTTTSL